MSGLVGEPTIAITTTAKPSIDLGTYGLVTNTSLAITITTCILLSYYIIVYIIGCIFAYIVVYCIVKYYIILIVNIV